MAEEYTSSYTFWLLTGGRREPRLGVWSRFDQALVRNPEDCGAT